MFMEGKQVSEIASALGVHRTTVYRWTTEPAFQLDLNVYREQLIEETFSLQILAAKRATLRLLELIEHDDPRIALSATKTAVPLKEAYVSMDRERRTRILEDNLDVCS